MANTDSLFAAMDTDYRFLAFNQPFQEAFKLTYGRDVILGAKLHELLADLPVELENALQLWARGLAGEEFAINQEFGEQQSRLYEIRFYTIRNEQHEIIGCFQLVQDISEKKFLIQPLGQGEGNLRGFFEGPPVELRIFAEAMPQMAFIADHEGNLTYYNQRHYDYFGIKKGDCENWKWTEIEMHPEDLAKTMTKWTEAIQKGVPYEMEYRLRRFDGSYRWHLARALPVRDSQNKIIRWVGTNTDIDDQKRTAQKLDQLLREVQFEKSRFEAVVKQMPAAVIIGEAPSGRLIFANNKMAEVWGHELIPSQNINEYIQWIGFHPDGRRYQAHEWPLARSISQGEVVNNEDVEIQRKDGVRAILRLSSTPLYDPQGEIVAGVVICQDVTELKEAIRGRDEFLSICSHELKTPLTSLKLTAQLVQRNIRKGDPQALAPERMNELLSQTDVQINRLNRLVEDMLDISRISTGRLSLEIKAFDLCQLLGEVTKHAQPLFEHAGGGIIMEHCQPTNFQGDPHRIEQVLTNLLSNAAKYGNKQPVTLSSRIENDHVVISIKDRGMGIATEDQQRIFNRYERLVSANEISGLGLGLFISKQIVELHHGKIWLESQVGQGSTFFVALPLQQK
jgi:PAS domain S-box-containing protein